MCWRRCTVVLSVVGVLCSTAAAGPILSGDVELVSAPPSLLLGAYESSLARLFFEGVFTVTTQTTVNIVNPGTYDYYPGTAVLGPGTYMSWFLHLDPPATSYVPARGTIQFEQAIAALIGTDAELNSSLASFGRPGTLYPTTENPHATDFGPPGDDVVTLSADMLTLTIDWSALPHEDQLRILTSVPEPASTLTLSIGLVLLALARRIRR